MGKRWWVTLSALLLGIAAVLLPHHASEATKVGFTPEPTAAEEPRAAAPRTSATTTTAPTTTTTGAPAVDLTAAVDKAVAAAGDVDLGLAVLDLDTGAVAGSQAAAPFHTASLSKLLVAVDVLGESAVSDSDRDLLTRALSRSDDEAMNALWDEHDGMGAVGRVAARAGLTATSAPADPTQWGDVEMSADDVVALYHYILTDLPADQRDFIVTALREAPATAADGFDQAFGLLGAGADTYAKQGWMWYLPATLYLHSSGVVADRFAVAMLSIHTGQTEQVAKDDLDSITQALLADLPTG
ncbi:hypothetical protein [Actinosynnema sp. NPDC020468]|uniref:serine hydrolase n=1 Tax=Actinosynnema sp. NPDC020468 TaxID=3154488 RepID=UPI0033D56A61